MVFSFSDKHFLKEAVSYAYISGLEDVTTGGEPIFPFNKNFINDRGQNVR